MIISPYATHHDPAVYPEPKRFRPERWEGVRRSVYEYLPFGAGPRTCIGASFAQQTLRLVLPTVLRRVRVRVVRDARIDRLTRANIMGPRRGIPAHVEAPHRRTVVPEPLRGNVLEMLELPN